MLTPGALMTRSQLTCFPEIDVFAAVIVHGPVYEVRVTPAGTPVFEASGNFPDVEPDPELVGVGWVGGVLVDGGVDFVGDVLVDGDGDFVGDALTVGDVDFGVKTTSA
jgi:hypothetical protein